MSTTDNVSENFTSVNQEFDQDMKIKQMQEELVKKFNEYRTTLNFMAADAPIEILSLESAVVEALRLHGCLRVYDLFDLDLTKIKGLGEIRIQRITSRLDQFFSML